MFVLNRLWRGDISPSQRAVRQDGEYGKVLSHLCAIGDKMSGEMTAEGRKLFEEFQEVQADLNGIECEDVFVEGFRLGAQLMLDTFGDSHTKRAGRKPRHQKERIQ